MPLSKIDSDSLTAPLTVPAGSAAAPAITTTGDTNTGIFFPAADTIAFSEGGAEAMRIDSSGQVGIGTSSPNARISLGSLVSNKKLFVYDDGTAVYGLGIAANQMRIFANSGDNLTFGNYVLSTDTFTERARIDSSGNLLVGTTSASGTPTQGMQVLINSGASSIQVGHLNGTTTGNEYAGFSYNATKIGSITQSGTTAVAFNTSSDYRLKENIAPMTSALARVAALKPCTYTWKSAPDEIGEGFIAHELAEVVPQCVTGAKDAVETYTDEDGNEATRPVYQGIDTSFLVATLTAAIQELKAIVDAQGAEIAALKGTP